MDHYAASAMLRDSPLTWGELREHMLDRLLDDEWPQTSTVNRSFSISQAFNIYDKALAERPAEQVIDPLSTRDELLACNVIRDFGRPMKI